MRLHEGAYSYPESPFSSSGLKVNLRRPSGFRVLGLGSRIQGFGSRVYGLGLRV